MNFEVIYTIKKEANEARIIGPDNNFLKLIEEKYNLEIIVRRGEILIKEIDISNKERLVNLFETLEAIFNSNNSLTASDLGSIINTLTLETKEQIINLFKKKDIIYTTYTGKPIYPRTLNQKIYYDRLLKDDVVFAIGPAGTGKTYLAIMYAIKALKQNTIRKIILVRPVVEAGEKLGYLPGDLKEKIDPYLVPLYDSLNEGLGKETVDKLIEKGVIEVAPLAYMRGRTLENAIVILDEAQNTTTLQMKMFLTRLGYNSKMIITGDITQIDLASSRLSGLIEAVNLLKDIDRISIVKLNASDVMRHPLVYKIIKRYEEKNDN